MLKNQLAAFETARALTCVRCHAVHEINIRLNLIVPFNLRLTLSSLPLPTTRSTPCSFLIHHVYTATIAQIDNTITATFADNTALLITNLDPQVLPEVHNENFVAQHLSLIHI